MGDCKEVFILNKIITKMGNYLQTLIAKPVFHTVLMMLSIEASTPATRSRLWNMTDVDKP